MRIVIYFFSGTGNTAWVVRRLAEQLRALGDEVEAHSCEKVQAADLDPAAWDMLGVAFPVHASFAPQLVRDFLRDLPPGEGTPLFAITTAGYAAGDTAWYAVRPLREKGYEPFLMSNVLIGNNLYIPGLPVLLPSPDEMKPRLAKAEKKIVHLAECIHRRERLVEGTGPAGRLLGIVQRGTSEWIKLPAFYADERCTRCGWCVAHCPVGNIEMTEEGVRFGDRCIHCMRCFNFCPVKAIQFVGAKKIERRYRGPEGNARLAILDTA